MKSIDDILKDRKTGSEEALGIFDQLDVVPVDFMIGRWKGFEIKSKHRMDGLLEATGWYGKLFRSPEEVHPLLFYTLNKKALYAVNPRIVPMHISFPKSNVAGILMKLAKPILQTKKSAARLRMIEYRGRVTATMCYDSKAILDHFAKIDDKRVMGVMDLKGIPEPYIFILERDDDADLKQNF